MEGVPHLAPVKQRDVPTITMGSVTSWDSHPGAPLSSEVPSLRCLLPRSASNQSCFSNLQQEKNRPQDPSISIGWWVQPTNPFAKKNTQNGSFETPNLHQFSGWKYKKYGRNILTTPDLRSGLSNHCFPLTREWKSTFISDGGTFGGLAISHF